MVSYGLELLLGDVCSDCRATEGPCDLVLLAQSVAHARLGAPAQVIVRKQLSLGGLSMNTLSSVPLAVNFVLDSEDLIWVVVDALTKVLGKAKLISHCGFHIFDGLLDNDSFWEVLFDSFVVNRIFGSIWYSLLAITESVSAWVYHIPVIVTVFLRACWNISVSLGIHGCGFRSLFK